MKEYEKLYRQLNDKQKLAVDTTEGPLLVLAGPGTGKTQLLSIRASAILDKKKVSPENILILTYTNPAAKAMKERLARVAGIAGYDIEVGTFHGFANSIIQESEEAANYAGDKVLMSDVECAGAIEYILNNARGIDEIRPFRAPYTYLNEIIKRISELKKDGITPQKLDAYLKRKSAGCAWLDEKYIKRLDAFSVAYRMYEELKEGKNKAMFDERGRYDFDDMIIFAAEAIRKEPDLRKELREQYRYIMVDEYQDTNGSQIDLLFALLGHDKANLACVGDDDQSIYRFQGASVGNFKLLSKRFPSLVTVSLKDNYRSSRELIDISEKLISMIPPEERASEKTLSGTRDYPEKEILFREFTSEAEELSFIIEKVCSIRDRIAADKSLSPEEKSHPYNSIAVLVRKREQILRVIDAFLRAGIPYATDGKEDISAEVRVRQLIDVLELAHIDPAEGSTKDLALYRVLSADYFGIPHSDILRLIEDVNAIKARSRTGVTLIGQFLAQFSPGRHTSLELEKPERLAKAGAAISRLLTDAATRPVHGMLLDFIKDADILGFILSSYDQNYVIRIREMRGLGSFVNMVKSGDLAKPAMRLDEFIREMKTRKEHGLPIQGNLVTLTQSGVRVYTAHGSKGLEFHTVVMPFCLQNRSWPAKGMPEKIKLPSDLFKTKERVREKEMLKRLAIQDETRLFYVAMTRAKANLIFTASPAGNAVSSFFIKGLDIDRESPDYPNEEAVIQKTLETTDLTDPFIGTEEVLKDMIGAMTLNPTRLNTYIICRRKFLYNDVLRLPGSKKKGLVFGNCVHKALEEVYTKYLRSGKFPDFKFFKSSFIGELRYQGVDKNMERDCLNKLYTLKGWFDRASREAVMPISLERKLMVTIGDNIIFTGKYDKVEWDEAGKGNVRIIDYKTGKPDRHLKDIDSNANELASPECDGYLRQLVAYKLLYEKDRKESRGRKVSSASLVFIEPVYTDAKRLGYRKGDYVTKNIRISDEMVTRLEEVIRDVWRDIARLRFEKLKTRDNNICANCDFDRLCWPG